MLINLDKYINMNVKNVRMTYIVKRREYFYKKFETISNDIQDMFTLG
jgi:hypothetical protein